MLARANYSYVGDGSGWSVEALNSTASLAARFKVHTGLYWLVLAN